jgi:hypothetical protein
MQENEYFDILQIQYENDENVKKELVSLFYFLRHPKAV